MGHDMQVARAETALRQGTDIRTRLLVEIEELEQHLRSLRETVNTLPPTDAISSAVPAAEAPRYRWRLWKK